MVATVGCAAQSLSRAGRGDEPADSYVLVDGCELDKVAQRELAPGDTVINTRTRSTPRYVLRKNSAVSNYQSLLQSSVGAETAKGSDYLFAGSFDYPLKLFI